MRSDLLKRIEQLERDATTQAVLWIDAPEAPLAGWEVVPMQSGGAHRVWRDGDETDDALLARAAVEANRHRGVVVCFGMDDNGVTR